MEVYNKRLIKPVCLQDHGWVDTHTQKKIMDKLRIKVKRFWYVQEKCLLVRKKNNKGNHHLPQVPTGTKS